MESCGLQLLALSVLGVQTMARAWQLELQCQIDIRVKEP